MLSPAVFGAPTQSAKESQLKAVFVLRLAQFVRWPPEAFPATNSPITIGVVGEDPFDGGLEAAVAGETAHGRRLVVRQNVLDSDMPECQILYIPKTESSRVASLSRTLRSRHTLTVSDLEGFAVKGGIVEFVTDRGKINLRINRNAAENAELELDARLLRLAELVRGK